MKSFLVLDLPIIFSCRASVDGGRRGRVGERRQRASDGKGRGLCSLDNAGITGHLSLFWHGGCGCAEGVGCAVHRVLMVAAAQGD